MTRIKTLLALTRLLYILICSRILRSMQWQSSYVLLLWTREWALLREGPLQAREAGAPTMQTAVSILEPPRSLSAVPMGARLVHTFICF